MDKGENTEELQVAIATIELFSRQKSQFHSTSLLKRTISFARQLFFSARDEQKNVCHAIEVIKKNRHLIQAWSNGTAGQKQLAQSAYAAVNSLNALSKELKKRPLLWQSWMINFSIEIPKPLSGNAEASHTYHVAHEKRKLTALVGVEKSDVNLSKQELDAFRMKAITLLKQHKVSFTSLSEQLQVIREVPIQVVEPEASSKCIVAMEQVISALPGELIQLKGAFQRYPESHCRSIPIPESFRLATQSHQTGFPHPSQHNGWALSQLLLPSEHPLLKKKDEIAKQLMPNGMLNVSAKELLKLKEHCVEMHIDDFVSLHQQLIDALLKRAKLRQEQFLEQFYKSLKVKKSAYNYLSVIHQQIILATFEKSIQSHKTPLTDLDLKYINLISQLYQKLVKYHPEVMRKLALKQLEEFIFELESLKVNSSEEMYSWIRETLTSDIAHI